VFVSQTSLFEIPAPVAATGQVAETRLREELASRRKTKAKN
jgi:hypothetical protein